MYQLATEAGRAPETYPTKAAATRAAKAIDRLNQGLPPVRVVPFEAPLDPAQNILARGDKLGLRAISYTNRMTAAHAYADGSRYWIPRDMVAKDGSAGIFFRINDADRRDVPGATYDFDGWEPWADVKHCGTLFGGRHRTYESALAWLEQYRPESVA